MDNEQKTRILELAIKALDDDISPEESSELASCISSSKELAAYYSTCIKTHLCMVEIETSQRLAQETSPRKFDSEFWQMMAVHEHIAPDVEIPEEKPQRELIQKVVYPPREKRKMSKFSISFLSIAAVALFFFVLILRFTPPQGGVEVATLTDSLNAKWANVGISMQKGARLYNDKTPFLLREGLAELKFDNHVQVTIEGPAELQIYDGDMIKLNYGQLYLQVPTEAYGFQVCTQHAKIIDLGTEFGVKEEIDGDTEVHVVRGKVNLVSGILNKKLHVDLLAGSARELNAKTGELKEIPCKENLFARQIDSKTNIIWRGQETLDLADMVRNGNGMGTGNSTVRLDPFKGFTNDQHRGYYSSTEKFLPITNHPFIDGIFIPNGDPGQIITSRGDVFAECPKTSGLFDCDLFANPEPGILTWGRRQGTIQFDGQEYTDKSGRSCIVMHANHGLTFDLDAIRKGYHRGIDRFTCRVGMADLNEIYPCNADFYVLIDGKVRYSLKQYKQKGLLNDVSIEIKDADRFLTLVTTDGGDLDVPGEDLSQRAITCDWGVFTDPVLKLK